MINIRITLLLLLLLLIIIIIYLFIYYYYYYYYKKELRVVSVVKENRLCEYFLETDCLTKVLKLFELFVKPLNHVLRSSVAHTMDPRWQTE